MFSGQGAGVTPCIPSGENGRTESVADSQEQCGLFKMKKVHMQNILRFCSIGESFIMAALTLIFANLFIREPLAK